MRDDLVRSADSRMENDFGIDEDLVNHGSVISRIVYVSGAHGTGKSTLISALGNYGYIVHNRVHSCKLEDTFERIMWRSCKLWIEACEQRRLAQENPKKIILGNRCRHDQDGYGWGFLALGWLTKTQDAHRAAVLKSYFTREYLPQNVIFLDPPFEWVKSRLIERWKSQPKKWNEDNFEYLHAVMHSFRQVYSNPPCRVLHVTQTSLDDRVQISREWIDRLAFAGQTNRISEESTVIPEYSFG